MRRIIAPARRGREPTRLCEDGCRVRPRLLPDLVASSSSSRMGQLGLVVPRHLRGRRARRVLPARPERDGRHHGRRRRQRRRSLAPARDRSRRARARSSATTSRTGSARWLGERTVKSVFKGEKSRKAFVWAEQPARGARLLPDHHRALHPGRPDGRDVLVRLHARRSRTGGSSSPTRSRRSSGGRYAALLGYIGGKQFEEEPWKGLLLAFVVAVARRGARRARPAPAGTAARRGWPRRPRRRRRPA